MYVVLFTTTYRQTSPFATMHILWDFFVYTVSFNPTSSSNFNECLSHSIPLEKLPNKYYDIIISYINIFSPAVPLVVITVLSFATFC